MHLIAKTMPAEQSPVSQSEANSRTNVSASSVPPSSVPPSSVPPSSMPQLNPLNNVFQMMNGIFSTLPPGNSNNQPSNLNSTDLSSSLNSMLGGFGLRLPPQMQNIQIVTQHIPQVPTSLQDPSSNNIPLSQNQSSQVNRNQTTNNSS